MQRGIRRHGPPRVDRPGDSVAAYLRAWNDAQYRPHMKSAATRSHGSPRCVCGRGLKLCLRIHRSVSAAKGRRTLSAARPDLRHRIQWIEPPGIRREIVETQRARQLFAAAIERELCPQRQVIRDAK